MTISKLDKIIDGFYIIYDKYQEVLQSRDHKGIVKYGKELADYLGEHRQVLEISDEYIGELNKALLSLEKTVTEADLQKNLTVNSYLFSEADKQAYFLTLLKELPIGKRRTEH